MSFFIGSICIFFLFIINNVVKSTDGDWCISKSNKHCAQNLDNPKWTTEDPYCGFNPVYLTDEVNTVKYWNVMNKGLFDATSWDNRWCGMCLKVSDHNSIETPAPSVIVKLVDYPTSYDIELQIEKYAEIGLIIDDGSGYIDVTPVVCPIDNKLTRSYLGYELGAINHYYLEIVVWDHIVPIEYAYIKGLDTSWTYSSNNGWFTLTRSTYNEFESNNLPELKSPFQLKIISVFGEELIEEFASWPIENSFVVGTIQFTDTGCMQTDIETTPSPTTPTKSPTKQPTIVPTAPQPTRSPITSQPTGTPITSQPTKESTYVGDACTAMQSDKFIGYDSSLISSDPYCGYKPAYAESNALQYWSGMGKILFDASSIDVEWCGMCVMVNYGSSSTIVKLVDSSGSYAMTLYKDTFSSIGLSIDNGEGYVDVKPVVCPIDNILTRAFLGYEFGGIDHYYLEIVIWDHIVPVKAVHVKGYDSSWDYSINNGWFILDRSTWNEFESNNLPNLKTPFNLKIISIFDEELIESFTDWTLLRNKFVAGTVQFSNTDCMATIDSTITTTNKPGTTEQDTTTTTVAQSSTTTGTTTGGSSSSKTTSASVVSQDSNANYYNWSYIYIFLMAILTIIM